MCFSYDRLNNLLNSDYIPKVNPFLEYFETLPDWDGNDHIEKLANTVELADQTQVDYWKMCLKKFLIGLTACAIDDSITNETSIILSGEQGIGKTKWLNLLVPDKLDPRKYLYVGTIYDHNKDSQLYLSTKLLINLDELESLNKDEIGYLKSLFTLDSITLREPYMRKSKTYVRRASFVGSVNKAQFLTDPTGSRRFLSFEAKDIDYEHNVNMDMVFAQALSLFKSGEKFYFDLGEIKIINENNEDFRIRSYEEELFLTYFSKPDNNDVQMNRYEILQTSEIAQLLNSKSPTLRITDATLRKLGQVMKGLGFTKKNKKVNKNSVKGWMVIKDVSLSLMIPKTTLFDDYGNVVVTSSN